MAGNAEVIESLKIEIDVGIKGQTKLDKFVERLNLLSAALTEANAKLSEYARLAGSVGNFRLPRITTPRAQTPQATIDNAPTDQMQMFGVSQIGSEAQDAVGPMQQLVDTTKQLGEAGKKAGEGIKETGKQIKKAGEHAKSASKHSHGLLSSFMRIAKYRAIRAVLKAITEGFREGIQNMARYSTEFNGVMSQLSTSTLYLKNSLGAVARPILEVLIPALTKLIDVVVKVLNVFAQLFSVMQGKSTYTRAKKYAVDYADSLDKANNKAKELKKSLLAFDEINQLTDNSSSTSGSNAQDYSQMFEEVPIDNGIIEFWDKVKAAIPTEAIEHFKEAWERLKEAVEKLAKSDAWRIIKNFIAGIVGFSLGALIEGFADLMDLIASIANFIAEPSWKNFLDVIEKLCDVILSFPDYVDTFLKLKIDESDLPEWLKKALDIGRWLLNIGIKATIPGGFAFDFIRKLIDGEVSIKKVGIELVDGAKAFLKEFENMGKAAKNAWDKTWKLNTNDNVVVKFFKSLLASIKAIFGLDKGAAGGGGGEMEKIGNNVVTGFFTPIKDKWDSFWNPIKEKIGTIKTTFTTNANDIKSSVTGAFNAVKSGVTNALDSIKSKATNVWNTVSSGCRNFVNNGIISPIERMINAVLKGLRWLLSKARKIINAFPDKVQKALNLDKIANATVEDVKLPRFAQGGFPEDGIFMANSRELVGSFSNGRTAVANNEQIEAGIEEAAYRGFVRAMGNSKGGNITFVAQLNGKTIFEEVVKQNDSAKKYYGKSPLLSY